MPDTTCHMSISLDGFGTGWNDSLRVDVVSAAVAGDRAVAEIRPAMRAAFDGFGTGWNDADRVRVVQAAVGGADAVGAVAYIKAARDRMAAETAATTA